MPRGLFGGGNSDRGEQYQARRHCFEKSFVLLRKSTAAKVRLANRSAKQVLSTVALRLSRVPGAGDLNTWNIPAVAPTRDLAWCRGHLSHVLEFCVTIILRPLHHSSVEVRSHEQFPCDSQHPLSENPFRYPARSRIEAVMPHS